MYSYFFAGSVYQYLYRYQVRHKSALNEKLNNVKKHDAGSRKQRDPSVFALRPKGKTSDQQCLSMNHQTLSLFAPSLKYRAAWQMQLIDATSILSSWSFLVTELLTRVKGCL